MPMSRASKQVQLPCAWCAADGFTVAVRDTGWVARALVTGSVAAMKPDIREGDQVSIDQGKAIYRVLDVWPNGTCTLVGTRNKYTVSTDRLVLLHRPGVTDLPG